MRRKRILNFTMNKALSRKCERHAYTSKAALVSQCRKAKATRRQSKVNTLTVENAWMSMRWRHGSSLRRQTIRILNFYEPIYLRLYGTGGRRHLAYTVVCVSMEIADDGGAWPHRFGPRQSKCHRGLFPLLLVRLIYTCVCAMAYAVCLLQPNNSSNLIIFGINAKLWGSSNILMSNRKNSFFPALKWNERIPCRKQSEWWKCINRFEWCEKSDDKEHFFIGQNQLSRLMVRYSPYDLHASDHQPLVFRCFIHSHYHKIKNNSCLVTWKFDGRIKCLSDVGDLDAPFISSGWRRVCARNRNEKKVTFAIAGTECTEWATSNS